MLFGLVLMVAGANSITQSFSRGVAISEFFAIPTNLIVGALLVVLGHSMGARIAGAVLFSIYC
jgi:hypothetical protein